MSRKRSISQPRLNINVIYWLILFSLFSITVVFADSEKTVKEVESYFLDINSALSTMGQDIASYGIKQAKGPMDKMLQDHPGINNIIRINSKGKVLNESVREGKPGKPNRNLSRQKWFRKIKNLKPYYSKLKTRKGDLLLFWCIPIRITKSGNERCGGAIITRIDLKRSFNALSKKTNSPFQVFQKDEQLFSNSWDKSFNVTTLPLTIKGLNNLQINVKKITKVAAVTPTVPAKKIKKTSKINLIVILLFVIIALALVFLWIILKINFKKKQEDLIRRIEGDEPFNRPDKSFDTQNDKEHEENEKTEKETLLNKRVEEVQIESEEELPSEELTKITQQIEVIDSAETKQVTPEIPPATPQEEEVEEESSMPNDVPEETVVLQSDFVKSIWEEEPENEESNTPEVTEENTPKPISSSIMEEVEPLLQKHLKAVLADRMKEIEEDVLDRVKNELADKINNNQ